MFCHTYSRIRRGQRLRQNKREEFKQKYLFKEIDDLLFLDINECAEQSCSPLFECEDLKDGFSCKLIVWKLLVIGLAVLMILGGFVFLLCFFKRKHNKITAGMPSAYVSLSL